jgi:signal transduction histidine kinase/ligand-binding sensor domain-containing protein
MKRLRLILPCLFIAAIVEAQQYPFVHYSPRDGLISNRVRSIYQDSKGKIYFNTLNGLSIYDGARFTNYTSEDGLSNDMVNCVMEMGDDSVWVVTNTGRINYIKKGIVKTVNLRDSTLPIINNLCRTGNSSLYAASDGGLLVFENNGFSRLPFVDLHGANLNSFMAFVVPYKNYLLVIRDYTLVENNQHVLYLYDCIHKKIVSQTSPGFPVYSIAHSNDGRIWISSRKGIQQLDIDSINRGKIYPRDVPSKYQHLNGWYSHIYFDQHNNCWLTDGGYTLKKCDTAGNTIVYTTASGLNTTDISYVFQDREGIIWLASNGSGVSKLMHPNLALITKPFGLSAPGTLVASADSSHLLLYSLQDKKIIRFTDLENAQRLRVLAKDDMMYIAATPAGWFGISSQQIFKLKIEGSSVRAALVFTDTSANRFGASCVDRNGNLIISGSHCLSAVTGNTVVQIPMGKMADQLAVDGHGNIWAASRGEQLTKHSTNPGKPSTYLHPELVFEKELKGINPRALAVDNNNRIWIGTRWKGIYVFEVEKEKLKLLHHFTSKTGLTENFVSWLSCDNENNIWAGSPSGLDKICIKKDRYVIENLTRQNNLYQYVYSVVIDKHKTAWVLCSRGLIKLTPVNPKPSGYTPQLQFTQIRNGTDNLDASSNLFLRHNQNNLGFYFAATSYLDEKQIQYRYMLEGSSHAEWIELGNNAYVSFIDLRPGNYILHVKAEFPAGRYAEQSLQFPFSIAPPWWRSWWFRLGMGIFGTGLVAGSIRFYYRRKLEKQKLVLEKQQAVEKERTRIATDMHDDLGAGLSRIKFLSETIGIKKQQQQSIDEDIIRIREYSHDMIDKMGEIVWALNEKNDSLSDLLSYTRSYAVEYLSQNGIRCRVSAPDNFPNGFVSGEFRRNIYLTVKEALHNVVKHSQASELTLVIHNSKNLVIEIQDNGVGFDKNNVRAFSNGISNMQKRIEEIGGRIEILNQNGTLVKISVPV